MIRFQAFESSALMQFSSKYDKIDKYYINLIKFNVNFETNLLGSFVEIIKLYII